MFRLFAFIALLSLALGLGAGDVHAVGPDSGIAMEAADSLHSDGDHDQVPADGHGDFPHHHVGCSGHDVGTGTAKPAGPGEYDAVAHRPSCRAMNIAEAPPATELRPPIA